MLLNMEELIYERFYGVFKHHGQIFYYDKKSLFIFNYKWKFRQAIVWLVESNVFKVIILITVLTNAIMMAAKDYEYRIDEGQ